MIIKWLGVIAVVTFFAGFLPASEAGPAYPGSTFNSWDTQTPPQQQQRQRTAPGQKRTLQSVVRQHIDDLDKQTQSDLKVLSYLETELNKIFSCYIKLSCPRMRSPKVLAECDVIKDWPLYHQVMKMAGIRRYPYQSYAPNASNRRITPTTELPETNQDEDTTTSDDNSVGVGNNEDDDEVFFQPPQQQMRPPRRQHRYRRGGTHQHHQHHLTGAPVTNDDNQ